MNGWMHHEGNWIETGERSQVEATMASIASVFRKIERKLDSNLLPGELAKLLEDYDQLARFWNHNIEFLTHLDRQEQVREIKASLSGLRWPPDGAPVEASS